MLSAYIQTAKNAVREFVQQTLYRAVPRPRTYAYLGGNRALTQLSTGAPFFVNTEDRGIATWIILAGSWESFVDDVLGRLAKPGTSFLDIGANMGYYTVKIGRLVGPEGRVYSFEPNPELFPFLRDNVYINGLKSHAQIWQVALGDAPGEAELGFDYTNMGGGSLVGAAARPRSVRVEIDTLDRLLPPGTRIDLIKIDAEGSEPKILAGAQRLLTENPAACMILEVSLRQWSRSGDPTQILNAIVGEHKEVFKIDITGRIVPMGSPSEFLSKVTAGFVSYCLIAPKDSSVREQLAGLISN